MFFYDADTEIATPSVDAGRREHDAYSLQSIAHPAWDSLARRVVAAEESQKCLHASSATRAPGGGVQGRGGRRERESCGRMKWRRREGNRRTARADSAVQAWAARWRGTVRTQGARVRGARVGKGRGGEGRGGLDPPPAHGLGRADLMMRRVAASGARAHRVVQIISIP
ncbi:hypothetical protein K438DRAFT_1781561 [Mycena galopus ATCC 62051]|nr:hypothetical protein K438DRAFT_1781561 [Mycena galopus ATCC 62051]